MRLKETNASKPLMKCRNLSDGVETGSDGHSQDKVGRQPVYCPTGTRHEGGVTLSQALVRNVGTCRPDAKGETPADSLCKGESTDAGHRDGAVRSRGEGPVMGLDRRGSVVRLHPLDNPQGEDRNG